MATTYLTSSYGSTTNRRTWTYSFWIKRTGIGAEQHIWGARNAASEPYIDFRFDSDDIINFYEYNGGSYGLWLKTNRVFRDCSGWYHFVVACDTTQAVASDRIKLYINGVQQTSFSTETYPAEDFDTPVNVSGYLCTVASLGNSGTGNFNGAMSHFYFIDGLAYAPTVFGEEDSDTGEWKIKTSPSVTYGTNGFLILKDGNTITDQGDNSNDFTLGAGTLTATEDCPDDVFCTWNSIQTRPYDTPTYSNGNTTVTRSGANWAETTGSLGATKGKYYWEMKPTGTVSSNCFIGICSEAWQNSNRYADADPYNSTLGLVLYYQDGEKTVNGVTTASFFPSFAADDIIGIALDLDAATKTVTFYKNNSIAGSAIDLPANMQTGFVLPVSMFLGSVSVMSWNANFGNGYFATTAISSEGTNASGIGKFEYDVPAGHTALSLKGMNS